MLAQAWPTVHIASALVSVWTELDQSPGGVYLHLPFEKTV